VWKINATAAEKLIQLANLANEKPELFENMMVMYQGEGERFDYLTHGDINTSRRIGLIELVKLDIVRDSIWNGND